MSPEYQNQLDKLSKEIVTPERFGSVAVSLALLPSELATVHTLYADLPEVVRLFPDSGESE